MYKYLKSEEKTQIGLATRFAVKIKRCSFRSVPKLCGPQREEVKINGCPTKDFDAK